MHLTLIKNSSLTPNITPILRFYRIISKHFRLFLHQYRRMKISPDQACPCDSGRSYKNCCQVLHKGGKAASPEALMRSRYSAYALSLAAYIMKTTHPDGTQYKPDQAAWKREIELFCQNTRFERLQILAAQGDMVTFR